MRGPQTKFTTALWIVVLLGCSSVIPLARGAAICPGASSSGRITGIRTESKGPTPGFLFAIIGKTQCKIADNVMKAWILKSGKQVVFSTPDGAGGFENEGQSLRLYDLASDTQRVILSEYFAINAVQGAQTSTGRRILIVEMRDGGLGASHVAIVDPNRGELFIEEKARVLHRKGDVLVLGYFHDEEWESLANGIDVPPYRTKSFNLSVIVAGKPIVRETLPR